MSGGFIIGWDGAGNPSGIETATGLQLIPRRRLLRPLALEERRTPAA